MFQSMLLSFVFSEPDYLTLSEDCEWFVDAVD